MAKPAMILEKIERESELEKFEYESMQKAIEIRRQKVAERDASVSSSNVDNIPSANESVDNT
jgi:hypothetical protein